jgi:hypothetical protein
VSLSDQVHARALFTVAPSQYVAERTRLAGAAKAGGDKASAAALKLLARPNLSMWAVLAAGAEERAVRFLLAATDEVAQTQAGGGNSAAIASAMQHRRTAVDALVDGAVAALRQWDEGAETRRPEIRSIVDKLSRLPELADSWLAGTLRELPAETLGFTSFTDMVVAQPPGKATAKGGTSKKVATAEPVVEAPVDTAEMRAERAARAEAQRQARKDLTAANRELISATRKLEAARTALAVAEESVRDAEDVYADIQRRRAEAEQRLAD